jgi:hypothetical protein
LTLRTALFFTTRPVSRLIFFQTQGPHVFHGFLAVSWPSQPSPNIKCLTFPSSARSGRSARAKSDPSERARLKP